MTKIILETGRLRLEELNENHFNDMYKLLLNKEVHKYFPKTLNKEESKEFLNWIKRSYKENGFSFWAVIKKEDSCFLGICGLLKQNIDGKEEIEVGYRINNKYWGNGYAPEAAKGCIEYAKEKLKRKSIISLIRPINKSSIRVAEKNGLTYEKDTIFLELPHRVYRVIF